MLNRSSVDRAERTDGRTNERSFSFPAKNEVSLVTLVIKASLRFLFELLLVLLKREIEFSQNACIRETCFMQISLLVQYVENSNFATERPKVRDKQNSVCFMIKESRNFSRMQYLIVNREIVPRVTIASSLSEDFFEDEIANSRNVVEFIFVPCVEI